MILILKCLKINEKVIFCFFYLNIWYVNDCNIFEDELYLYQSETQSKFVINMSETIKFIKRVIHQKSILIYSN